MNDSEQNILELATAIRDAAVLAGIVDTEASLTGPQLIMLCEDMGVMIKNNSIEKFNQIPHVDERIIEILTMFAVEIKLGRVREGEAIDKAACALTAYMAGVVDAAYVFNNRCK